MRQVVLRNSLGARSWRAVGWDRGAEERIDCQRGHQRNRRCCWAERRRFIPCCQLAHAPHHIAQGAADLALEESASKLLAGNGHNTADACTAGARRASNSSLCSSSSRAGTGPAMWGGKLPRLQLQALSARQRVIRKRPHPTPSMRALQCNNFLHAWSLSSTQSILLYQQAP